MKEYILSIDQGTTATKVVLYDLEGNEKLVIIKPVKIITPVRDWVEHSPGVIFSSIQNGIKDIFNNCNISPKEIIGVAIDNQGETIIPFNKTTLEPLYNAIVWQDNRTAEDIISYNNPEIKRYVEKTTGLFMDPYFSAPKMKWLIDNIPEVQTQMKKNNLIMATSEVWIINKLIKRHNYYTDVTTASRTMLFDIEKYEWDEKIIDFFALNKKMMPEITPTIFNYGVTDPEICSGVEAPLISSVVDQQSALYGHRCFNKGEAKLTLGTGGFLLVNIGSEIPTNKDKLITTVCPQQNNEKQYVIDGGIYTVGSAVDWLKNKIELFGSVEEISEMVKCEESNVFFVPALAGLSVPYWTTKSNAAFIGMGLDTDKNQLLRAVLESISFRVYQIMDLIQETETITTLSVDGGVSNNNFLVNYLSELSGIRIIKPKESEITALGGCYLAGLGLGVWSDLDQIKKIKKDQVVIKKDINRGNIVKYEKWKEVVTAIIAI
ncbi:MAG: hypothetical protein KAQ93_02170 [Spirochaetales bacterium]|nr:hypothetical protein [Spirochaetales bacterium]